MEVFKETVPLAKTKNIFFDLDGTLLDSSPGISDSLHYALDSVAPRFASAAKNIEIGPPIQIILKDILPTQNLIDEVSKSFRSHYDTIGWQKATLYPGVLDLLTTLQAQGRRIFIVTNKPAFVTERVIAHFFSQTSFDDVQCVDLSSPSLTHKSQVVNALLKDNLLEPLNTVLVGDTDGDGIAAVSNNLLFIWASYGYGSKISVSQDRIFRVLDEPKGLMNLLQD